MISNMCLENETDLFFGWFLDLGKKRGMYKEPILNESAVRFFKQICDAFGQNAHVFIMTIEVAEDYIRAKKSNRQKINDPILAAVTITFMCHKCEGAPECLKVKHVIDLLYHLTQIWYTPSQVTTMEGDIIVALDGKLPITTTLDDLDIVIERYTSETKAKANVRPLCLKILEYLYMEKCNWFKDLQNIYSQNRECVIVFRHLITSNFFMPVSILIAAIELTHYHHILDTDTILCDITKHTKIHADHIRVMASKIIEMLSFA